MANKFICFFVFDYDVRSVFFSVTDQNVYEMTLKKIKSFRSECLQI